MSPIPTQFNQSVPSAKYNIQNQPTGQNLSFNIPQEGTLYRGDPTQGNGNTVFTRVGNTLHYAPASQLGIDHTNLPMWTQTGESEQALQRMGGGTRAASDLSVFKNSTPPVPNQSINDPLTFGSPGDSAANQTRVMASGEGTPLLPSIPNANVPSVPNTSNASMSPDKLTQQSNTLGANYYGNLMNTIPYGTRGDNVTALQNFLIGQGFLHTNATGYYGDLTKAAIAQYQRAQAQGGNAAQPQNASPTPPIPQTGGNAQTLPQNATTGQTGGNTGGNTGVPTSLPDNPSMQQIMDYFRSVQTPTATEQGLQQQAIAQEAQRRNLVTGQQQANLNIENQPIALPFVTGQQAQVGKQYAIQQEALGNQQQTTQAQLQYQQSLRQAALDASKFALEYAKPVALGYGGALVRPTTGETIASSISPGGQQLISQAINEGRLDPSQVTRWNMPAITATLTQDPTHDFRGGLIDLRRQEGTSLRYTKDAFGNLIPFQTKGPAPAPSGNPSQGGTKQGGTNFGTGNAGNGNINTPRANAAAVEQSTKKLSAITAAHEKLTGDLNAIAGIADQVNKLGIPDLDAFVNGLNNRYTNNPLLVQFKHLVTSARGDYAVINSGGQASPDQGDQQRAAGAIPANGNSQVYLGLLQTVHGEASRQIAAQQKVIGQFSNNRAGGNQSSGSPIYKSPAGNTYKLPY